MKSVMVKICMGVYANLKYLGLGTKYGKSALKLIKGRLLKGIMVKNWHGVCKSE